MKYLKDQQLSAKEVYKLIFMIIGITIVVALIVSSFTEVAVGHGALVIDPISNTISPPHLGAKWFFRWPWTSVADIYYSMTSTEMWTDQETNQTGEYPAIHVLSKDGLDIEVDILIRYQLDPLHLVALYQSFPDLRWEDRAISSIVREDVRDVVSQYTVLEIIEVRELISTKMRETIYNSLVSETSLSHALLETSIEIDLRDIDPPLKFKEAIEAKLTAEQQKIQAEFEKARIIILANATAQDMIIRSEGEAKAKITVAKGTREAIELILTTTGSQPNSTRIAELYLWVETLKQIAPNIDIFLMSTGEDGLPLLVQVPTNASIN